MSDKPIWRRTWPDQPFDFVAEINGKHIARIYRHTNGKQWQWFDLICGSQGIEETRQQAIDTVLPKQKNPPTP